MTVDTFDKHPMSLDDYEASSILVLFLFYSVLANSLKTGNLCK